MKLKVRFNRSPGWLLPIRLEANPENPRPLVRHICRRFFTSVSLDSSLRPQTSAKTKTQYHLSY